MVEQTLAKLKKVDNLKELKTHFAHQIPHTTLKLILDYLDYSKKIQRTSDSIVWIHKEDIKEENLSKKLSFILIKNNKDGVQK